MFRSILRNASEKSDVNTNPTGFFHDSPLDFFGDVPKKKPVYRPRHLQIRAYEERDAAEKGQPLPVPSGERVAFGENVAAYYDVLAPASNLLEIERFPVTPEVGDIELAVSDVTVSLMVHFGKITDPAQFADAWRFVYAKRNKIGAMTVQTFLEKVVLNIEATLERVQTRHAMVGGEYYVNAGDLMKSRGRPIDDLIDAPVEEGKDITPAQEACMELAEIFFNIKPRQIIIPFLSITDRRRELFVDYDLLGRATNAAAVARWLLESPESPARQA